MNPTKKLFCIPVPNNEKDKNGVDLKKQKILRRGGKNTQKNYTKKIFTTQIITMG